MKTYYIADINGTIYAHDIKSEGKAFLILCDVIEQLMDENGLGLSEHDIHDLEIEILEEAYV